MTGGLRILIVEDYDGCRELYSLWLGTQHDVETVENGTRALRKVDHQVDLVLIDHDMPGPSGSATAREMRACGYEGGIILVTSQPCTFDIGESPFDDYLQKPVSREALESAVSKFATRNRLESLLDEYYALTATKAKLTAAVSEDDLKHDDEYLALQEKIEAKRAEVNEILLSCLDSWHCAFAVLNEMGEPDTPEATSNCPSPPQLS